jgi:hypothetical protein
MNREGFALKVHCGRSLQMRRYLRCDDFFYIRRILLRREYGPGGISLKRWGKTVKLAVKIIVGSEVISLSSLTSLTASDSNSPVPSERQYGNFPKPA